MLRRFWTRLSPNARAHIVVAVLGFVVGAIFGDLMFGAIEEVIGDPLDELVFGIAGAAIFSVAYDIFAIFRRRT